MMMSIVKLLAPLCLAQASLLGLASGYVILADSQLHGLQCFKLSASCVLCLGNMAYLLLWLRQLYTIFSRQ